MAVNYKYRADLLKQMHEMVLAIGDEDEMEFWFYEVLSEDADEEDFMDIAEDDEEYERVRKVFLGIVNRSLK